MKSREIREQFLEFFRSKQHTIVPSSPVVPHDDPTLMFTNAGMNQFKDVFLGTGTRPYVRAADTQKCIRAGGKHNDLDDVGQDTYHHTFFEMLGNWSFGDYFKKEAIAWAWELLTEVWKIDPERLHATYFEGDAGEGLEPDTEARDLWLKILPKERVHPGNKKDNFWEMGDTGPCGPCSEIHIDLTPDRSGGRLVNAGDARVMEIWNLVFIQFNRDAGGRLTPLPAKHVDTGMGFERICAVLAGMAQGRIGQISNYDTDVFTPIFAAIQQRTNAPKYTGLLPVRGGGTQSEAAPQIRAATVRERTKASKPTKTADPTKRGNLPLAYFITFTTYGTWLHGSDKGSVDREHNIPGTPTLPPDPDRENASQARQTQVALTLNARSREIVTQTIHEVAKHRGWQIHALNVRTNHVHVVVTAEADPEPVMLDFKSYATRRLVETGALPSNTKVWTRHGSTRYLWNADAVQSACVYTVEGQGDELPGTDEGGRSGEASGPLPYSRGSETTAPLPDSRGSDKAAADHNQLMVDVTYRVIADHLRCLVFAITDGAIPDREGRGYVLRRILRRAVRYGWQYLNIHEPFLCDLVEPLAAHMGDAFPELRAAHNGRNLQHVVEVLRDEEESFGRTLERGIRLFEEAAEEAVTHHHGKISGDAAFKLHDTYGFPIDLTELMAEERGLTVNIGEYERLMDKARIIARAPGDGEQSQFDIVRETGTRHGKPELTDDSFKYADELECQATVNALAHPGPYPPGRGLYVVFSTDKTCFYGEQGGQVSDQGLVITSSGARVRIDKVARFTNHVAHGGIIEEGSFKYTDTCRMIVDKSHRLPTMQNHTATHLLNWALRDQLGEGVQQKGSLVDPDKTRFDFSHNKPVADDEIHRIEELVVRRIGDALPVYTRQVEQQSARRINTLRAVFGEKYPDVVRVVSIGADIGALLANPTDPQWMNYSVEFCGGTHVKNTADIGHFAIVSEEGVAKGVRRIVGLGGDKARQAIADGEELLAEARELATSAARTADPADLQSRFSDLARRVTETQIRVIHRRAIQAALAEVQKALKHQTRQAAAQSGDAVMQRAQALLAEARTIGGVTVVVGEVPTAGADALRGAVDWIRQKTESSAVLLATAAEGKVTLIAGMSKDAVARGLKAGDLIKEISPLVGGKGGGRPDMAQGGGADPESIPQALEAAAAWIGGRLTG